MQLDGYRLELNNTILFFTKIDDEIKGKERPFNQTPVWEQAKYYIDFYSSKEQKPDKIPLRKSVEALEKKLEKNKQLNIDDILSLGVISAKALGQNNSFSNSDSGQFSQDSSSDSLASSSLEDNKPARQDKLNKSKIPVLSRGNTEASLFKDSRNESPKIFKLDIKKRLVILSQEHPFLENISLERKKIPLSHRNAYRIDNLTNNELESLNTYLKKPIMLGR
jgi:hypothetical protein